jgi:hypothetical protein
LPVHFFARPELRKTNHRGTETKSRKKLFNFNEQDDRADIDGIFVG